jgi:hypothetical protein
VDSETKVSVIGVAIAIQLVYVAEEQSETFCKMEYAYVVAPEDATVALSADVFVWAEGKPKNEGSAGGFVSLVHVTNVAAEGSCCVSEASRPITHSVLEPSEPVESEMAVATGIQLAE